MNKRFSDFWISDNTKSKLDENRDLTALELAKAKRSISDFVRIMTKQNIPVEYREEEGKSYTDGEKITIGADVREGFDATVGTALHESSHIVRSDFDMLDQFREADENGTAPDFVPQDIIDGIEPLLEKSDQYKEVEEKLKNEPDFDYEEVDFSPEAQATRAIHHIWNVVEDRWIDQWAYNEAPGYKGYYRKMYKKYWHSDEMSEKLQSDEGTDLDWSSYAFRITNISNPDWGPDALPGLRKIWDILDLNNIERHDSSWDCLDTAIEIMRVVLEHAEHLYIDPSFGAGENGEGDNAFEDLPDDLQEMLEDQLEQMQGEAGEDLDQETAQEVDALEDAGVDETEVGESVSQKPSGNSSASAGIDCVIIESLSEAIIEQGNFRNIISESPNRKIRKAVDNGFKKGRILGNRLKIRDERRETRYSRKRSGSLDNRMLAEIGYSSDIFYTEEIEEYKDGFIHISVDASGSMSGSKFENAMETCVAISKAADMIENIRVQVSFRSRARIGNSTKPLILVAYDSKNSPIGSVRKFFPYLSSGGTTPEGLTFEAIQDKILPSNKERDSYFINLSDGMPNFHNHSEDFGYAGEQALSHTRSQIRKMKKRGVQVLSYYIGQGNHDKDFVKMYGKDSRFIDPTDIMGVRKTLNKKFTEQDGKRVSS